MDHSYNIDTPLIGSAQSSAGRGHILRSHQISWNTMDHSYNIEPLLSDQLNHQQVVGISYILSLYTMDHLIIYPDILNTMDHSYNIEPLLSDQLNHQQIVGISYVVIRYPGIQWIILII